MRHVPMYFSILKQKQILCPYQYYYINLAQLQTDIGYVVPTSIAINVDK